VKYLVLLASVIVQSAGGIYAWSTFVRPGGPSA